MMEYIKLSEAADIITGFPFKSEKFNTSGEGLKLIRGKNIGKGFLHWGEDARFLNEKFEQIEKYSLQLNDIVIGMDGSNVGKNFAVVTKNDLPSLLVQRVARVRAKQGFDQNYLKYCILNNNFTNYVNDVKTGSAIPHISGTQINNFLIQKYDYSVQQKIGKIIDSISKRIELNNEINNNLYEVSKQLLLKYLEENSDSEEINISELLNVFTGKKNANETSPTGKYKFFSCAPESLLSDTYLYDGAAIIVAGNGAYTGRTRFYDGKFELYQRTYGLTLKDGFDKDNIYGLYVFMKTIFEPDKMGGTHGSAIPYIVLSDLTDYKLKYNKSEFDKFSSLVSGNIKMIQDNEKSNEELSKLRDTLLPKLMNGEIDLDNIEI